MKLIKFAIIGTIGFFVEAIILYAFKFFWPDTVLIARIFSFPPAVFTTWWLNRVWTFSSRKGIAKEFCQYLGTQLVGIGFNFLIYATLVKFFAYFYNFPLYALAISSIVVMVWNFLLSHFWVFK